jgi:tetratricopeptide (TPR) repeat protein
MPPQLSDRIATRFSAALDQTGAFGRGDQHAIIDGSAPVRIVARHVTGRPHGLHLSAMLGDAQSGASLATAEATGSIDSLDDAINPLVRGLAADAFENNGEHLLAAAVRSTVSLPALRAFVIGEGEYRSGRYDAAVRSFQTAVARDPAFALAHYRLGVSLLWQEQPAELAAVHDSLALRLSSGLAPEEQILIRAYVAWRRGNFAMADSLYRDVIARDPRNTEALFQFGETLFHYNPLRGRSVGEARGWFDRVLTLDSANWGARWHIVLLDAATLSPTELRTRVAALLESQPDGYVASELRLFAADAGNGELARLSANASGTALFDAAWRRAVYRHDLSGAESLLLRMTEDGKPTFEQATGSAAAGVLRLGQGRFRAALPLLVRRRAMAIDANAWTLLVQGVLANRAVDGPIGLDSLASTLEHWRQSLGGFDQPTSAPSVVSVYLGGLLAAARDDTLSAGRSADQLERMRDRHDPYLPPESRDPRELARTVRAYQRLRTGRFNDALRELDAATAPYWLGVVASSPLAAQSFERFLRAECLLALGRNREALVWLATFEQNTVYDLGYLGIVLHEQATAYRALGELEAARRAETRLTELWRASDPEIRSALTITIR